MKFILFAVVSPTYDVTKVLCKPDGEIETIDKKTKSSGLQRLNLLVFRFRFA